MSLIDRIQALIPEESPVDREEQAIQVAIAVAGRLLDRYRDRSDEEFEAALRSLERAKGAGQDGGT